MDKTSFDVIIIGGGITGLTLALAIAKCTDLHILVLEPNTQTSLSNNETYHPRVSSINLASEKIFKSLGVWQNLKSYASIFRVISVWSSDHKNILKFHSQEIGQTHLGSIIENVRITGALSEALLKEKSVTIASCKPLQINYDETSTHVISSDQKNYNTQLLIGCDGAKSWTRNQAGITLRSFMNHQEIAIVSHVETTKPHNQVAAQIFLPTGPLAFLPLREAHSSSIVWTLPKELASNYFSLDDQSFMLKLNEVFNHLGNIKNITKRFQFPLMSHEVNNYVKERIILIGDAAHSVHPLAGQGANLSIADAWRLSQNLAAAIDKGKSFHNKEILRDFERQTKSENWPMLRGIPFIKTAFSFNQPPIKKMRAIGLACTNYTPWLKRLIMKHAVGI